jgi:hypothetical protein
MLTDVGCELDRENEKQLRTWASESKGKARRKESRYIAEGRRLVGATIVHDSERKTVL